MVLHDVLAKTLENTGEAASPLDLLGVSANGGSSGEQRSPNSDPKAQAYVSLNSLTTLLTQKSEASLYSPTKGPGLLSYNMRRWRLARLSHRRAKSALTAITHPRAGIPSATTVSWLLSLLARFFSL